MEDKIVMMELTGQNYLIDNETIYYKENNKFLLRDLLFKLGCNQKIDLYGYKLYNILTKRAYLIQTITRKLKDNTTLNIGYDLLEINDFDIIKIKKVLEQSNTFFINFYNHLLYLALFNLFSE